MVKSKRVLVVICVTAMFLWTYDASAQWIYNGMRVSTDEGSQFNDRIITDESGGALVFWSGTNIDSISGGFVQRIDADGYRLWGGSGKLIDTDDCWPSTVIPDGDGGAFLAWMDGRNHEVSSWDIYAQRIDADGNKLWISGGVPVCEALLEQAAPVFIVQDGTGGAIFVWFDRRNGCMDIYAQRVNGNGVSLWQTDGVPVCTAPNHQYIRDVVTHGAGGAVIVWIDLREGIDEYDIYAQHIGQDGNALWGANGQAICTAPGEQLEPVLVQYVLGEIIIVWEDWRNSPSDFPSNIDIYGQRLDVFGNQLWTAGGKAICTEASNQRCPRAVTDGEGGAIIAWEDNRNDNSDIYAQRIDMNGLTQWASDGVPVTQALSTQNEHIIVADGRGGAIIAWKDYRDLDSYDLYAQRIDADGATSWTSDGVAVRTSEHSVFNVDGISDGAGGAIFTWDDPRDAIPDEIPRRYRVYAQRVDAAGNTVVATLLQSYSVDFLEGSITLTWTLSEISDDVGFYVLRSCGASESFDLLPSDYIKREGNSLTYIDRDLEPGTCYRYRIEYRDENGRGILFETGSVTVPAASLTLMQNHPNPFNPSTEIRYCLPGRFYVVLDVYDVSGSFVIRLDEGSRDRGPHVVKWDGRDGQGRQVGSGVYFCTLVAGKTRITKKMILLK